MVSPNVETLRDPFRGVFCAGAVSAGRFRLRCPDNVGIVSIGAVVQMMKGSEMDEEADHPGYEMALRDSGRSLLHSLSHRLIQS